MNKTRNCIYIPSCDAKDLYLANNFKNNKSDNTGYRLITKNGDINFNRFINSLDFSLDSEKIREIAKDIYSKDKHFTFTHNGKEYSDKIINVTFKYTSRDFNKIKKDTYVMEGYRYEDLHFVDNVAQINGVIVGIIISSLTMEKTRFDLPDGFTFVEDKSGNMIYDCKNIGVSLSKKELREELYKNGFNCNGNHYVRLKRTSGSSRVGKCLFVEESLYPEIHEWEMCSLEISDGDEVDLAALEAYISLPTSSAIDILDIDPKSILVIPDYDSVFMEESVVVGADKNRRITVSEENTEISNSIFDGQSLIDVSIMGEYKGYGMVLLRNRFFKSCCFNTNIQKWFLDKNIKDLSQLHPDYITLADKIEDVKLITTPNSIKYIKFAPIVQWLNNIDSTFSVIKHDKKTHFFDGRMVQCHYQLLNTLQLSKDDMHELLKPSLDYVNLLNTNTDVLKYHVKCSILDDVDGNIINVFKDKNELVYIMMNLSDDFFKTKYFYDFKKETCKAYLKNIKRGHILVDGNYSVLFGNPFEMLLHCIGQFDGSSSIPHECVHTTRYPYGERILGCRSPHISTSNILVSTNVAHELIDTYFNLTPEIVCMNAINENVLERLSSADYDSDTMIVTNNKILIRTALKNYDIFKVPANRVPANKVKRTYTAIQKADLDYKTSENKIGEIVNLSQELNTLMWDYVNKSKRPLTECYDEIKELYHDICTLNVLSCIEIDKAKKEFDISSGTEIRVIKEKWKKKTFDEKTIKPAFLGFIAQTKGYRDPKKKKYCYHETSMDYLLREINRFRSQKSNVGDLIPFSQCFKFPDFNQNSVNKKQLSKIVKMCETTTSAINAVWSKDYYETSEKYLLTSQYKNNLAFDIQNMKINPHTMSALIEYIDAKKYSHISKLLFYILFNYSNGDVLETMRSLSPARTYIDEDTDGEVMLYDIRFKRFGGDVIDKS